MLYIVYLDKPVQEIFELDEYTRAIILVNLKKIIEILKDAHNIILQREREIPESLF